MNSRRVLGPDSSALGEASNATGSGAPTDAQYVTLASNTSLTAERTLTAGSGISITDGGAGSTVTIAASGGSGLTQPQVMAIASLRV